MKPKPTDTGASDTSATADELLERAANRLAIRRYGCAIDSLRDRELARALVAEAEANRRRWLERRNGFDSTP